MSTADEHWNKHRVPLERKCWTRQIRLKWCEIWIGSSRGEPMTPTVRHNGSFHKGPSQVGWWEAKPVYGELVWTYCLRSSLSSFLPRVWSAGAGAVKSQNGIGHRGLSAAISGAEVGQVERNRAHCMLPMISVACSALCSSCVKCIIMVARRRSSKYAVGTAHPTWGKIWVNLNIFNAAGRYTSRGLRCR